MDPELNDTGIAQAKKSAEQLKHIDFDMCYCSPYKRARQTRDIVYKGESIIANRLRERDFGEYEGVSFGEVDWDMIDARDEKALRHMKSKKCESLLDVENRVFPLLDKILGESKGKNILLVTHGGVAHVIRGYFDENIRYGVFSGLGEAEIMKFDDDAILQALQKRKKDGLGESRITSL